MLMETFKGTVHRFYMGAATVDFMVSRIGPITPSLLRMDHFGFKKKQKNKNKKLKYTIFLS